MLKSCKDELCRRIVNGVGAEVIHLLRVATHNHLTCPELLSDALGSGNLTVRLHDDLPFYEMCLFDERIAISVYDPDSVLGRVLIDTDLPGTHE